MTNLVEELKCKDKVKDAFNRRFKAITRLYDLYCQGNDGSDEDLGRLNEYGLCFDYVKPFTFTDQPIGYHRYQLSYGGPSEEFRIFTRRGTITTIEFWYLDWFDGAKVNVTGKKFVALCVFFNDVFDLSRKDYD